MAEVNIAQQGKSEIEYLGKIDVSDLKISVSDAFLRADIYTLTILRNRIDGCFEIAKELGKK